jgi:hypothetical protein
MKTIIAPDGLSILQHGGQGFFSCCTFQLQSILEFYNENKQFPAFIDCKEQFWYYKTPANWHMDIRSNYFDDSSRNTISPSYTNPIIVSDNAQFTTYDSLPFAFLAPFVEQYFSPSSRILSVIDNLIQKYHIDPDTTCAVLYRGNDKAIEMTLPDYSAFRSQTSSLRMWIQSDETEFLETMSTLYSNSIICWDEIRHMRRCSTTVDNVFRNTNPIMSEYFLGIIYLISRCKRVIMNCGNISMWVTLFRGNTDGITVITSNNIMISHQHDYPPDHWSHIHQFPSYEAFWERYEYEVQRIQVT